MENVTNFLTLFCDCDNSQPNLNKSGLKTKMLNTAVINAVKSALLFDKTFKIIKQSSLSQTNGGKKSESKFAISEF